ncbi:unnamed protein product [Triticum turgidum subsp. durum]|uniref:Ribosomal protein L32 n=1 Tax=Triticum turgidum subsp. durum TaxID=4567 RepID=A0A9R0S8X3_TRITD|nr:unnamed protein product [Triticum turgidum subsp. durum]
MTVPTKLTSMSKRRIHKNNRKKKTYFSIVQSHYSVKSRSFSSGNEHPKPKVFAGQQTNKKILE